MNMKGEKASTEGGLFLLSGCERYFLTIISIDDIQHSMNKHKTSLENILKPESGFHLILDHHPTGITSRGNAFIGDVVHLQIK